MSVIKGPCEHCGSKNNLVTYENGSQFCHSNGGTCQFNKIKRKSNLHDSTDQSVLIDGVFTALPSRRISQRTCEFFNYTAGVDNGESVQIANYKGSQKIRTRDKRFYWKGDKKDVTLYGKDKWSNGSNSIIITEGELDAMSIAEAQDCKWPVVSLPNGSGSARKTIQAELDWLLGFNFIILCFDQDEAGRQAIESCTDLFPPGKLRIASLSEKDASDCLTKGKYEELTKIVFNAQEFRPDGIIAGSEIDLDDLYNEEPKGIRIVYPILDEMIRGLKTGRIYTIYAGTGNGKTTFLKEIVYGVRLNAPDIKIANIFLEESQKFTALSYIAMDNNIPTYKLLEDKNIINSKNKTISFNKLLNAVNGDDKMYFYRHFGSLDSRRLFNLLEYYVVGKGVKLVVLDHITILVSGLESSQEGERRDIDRLITMLRSFSERTGAIIIVATQLRRKQGSYSEGAHISESDARGSGSIEHLSDVIISLNRDKTGDNPNDLQLNVIKNRITGLTGNSDLLCYNSNTGRLINKHGFIGESSDELY